MREIDTAGLMSYFQEVMAFGFIRPGAGLGMSCVRAAAALAVLAFLSPALASPGDNGGKDGKSTVVLPAGEVINEDYFTAGETVEVSGTVNGDVYAFGGRVLVKGKVNGDLLAAGGAITISGDVTQDVRAAGGRVTVSGTIGRNLTVLGGSVQITNSASVEGAVTAAGGEVGIAGPVGGNARVGAGSLVVSNRIGGDLKVAAREIRLAQGALINGELAYWSPRRLSIAEGAKVLGPILRKQPEREIRPFAFRIAGGLGVIFKLISFFSTLVIGLLVIRLFPNFAGAAVASIRERPLASLGVGLLVFVLVPVLVLLLFITVLGIHLALILLALYAVSLYVSRVVAVYWVGATIFGTGARGGRAGCAFAGGLIVYYLLTLVPVLGGIVAVLVTLFGLGAAAIAEKRAYRTGPEAGR